MENLESGCCSFIYHVGPTSWQRLMSKLRPEEFGSHDLLADVYHDHESGLKMVYNRETGQDISEDKEGFNQEGVDSDEEEDVEESSDEENDKS